MLDLARTARKPNLIAAASAVVIIANRVTGEVVDGSTLAGVEGRGGTAILRAVASVDIAEIFEGIDLDSEDGDEEASGAFSASSSKDRESDED